MYSVLYDSSQPHGLQPTSLLCPQNFLGKNTGAGCLEPTPGDLPKPGIKPESPALQADYHLSHQETHLFYKEQTEAQFMLGRDSLLCYHLFHTHISMYQNGLYLLPLFHPRQILSNFLISEFAFFISIMNLLTIFKFLFLSYKVLDSLL